MNLDSKVNFLLSLQTQMRINHWQTKGYARHQAFGNFYEVVDGLIDSFIESSMGKYGRFVLNDETRMIELKNMSEIDIKGLINMVRSSFVEMDLDPSDTDLLNIRDEMLGELNKLSYLLTLE